MFSNFEGGGGHFWQVGPLLAAKSGLGGDHFWLPKLVLGDRFWLPKLVPGPHLGRTIFGVTVATPSLTRPQLSFCLECCAIIDDDVTQT